jgi:hypothetical protein
MKLYFFTLLALAVAFHSARASEPDCDTETFPGSLTDGVSLLKVLPARTVFLRDGDGCPEAGDGCAAKAYLVSGDTVVAAQARGAFRCVAFAGPRGQTTGWIRQYALSPVDMLVTGDWAGKWARVRGSATLTIVRHGAHYQADMLATAHAADPGNVRTGVASGELAIDGTKATVRSGGPDESDICTVYLRRIGPFLIANDGGTPDANSACDGMGVTLNGIYRRTRKP